MKKSIILLVYQECVALYIEERSEKEKKKKKKNVIVRKLARRATPLFHMS